MVATFVMVVSIPLAWLAQRLSDVVTSPNAPGVSVVASALRRPHADTERDFRSARDVAAPQMTVADHGDADRAVGGERGERRCPSTGHVGGVGLRRSPAAAVRGTSGRPTPDPRRSRSRSGRTTARPMPRAIGVERTSTAIVVPISAPIRRPHRRAARSRRRRAPKAVGPNHPAVEMSWLGAHQGRGHRADHHGGGHHHRGDADAGARACRRSATSGWGASSAADAERAPA